MKKLVLLLCVLAIVGYSQQAEARGHKDPCKTFLGSILNECIPQKAEPEAKMEIGVGVDIPLYKSEGLIVDQETKLDLNTNDGFGEIDPENLSTYMVFKPQLEEGILQTAWAKLKSIFTGE